MEKDATATLKAKLKLSKGLRDSNKRTAIKLMQIKTGSIQPPMKKSSTKKLNSLDERLENLTQRMRELNQQVRARMTKGL